MSNSAHVQSLESIETVKNSLASYADHVRQSLTILDLEIRRALDWLEHDRPRYWKGQIHRANDEVAQAQANLHRCLMFTIADERPACREERAALRRAQARLAYCQEKLERVKHWVGEVHREQFEFAGRMGKLAQLADVDLPKAVGVLTKLVRRLEEYQAVGPRGSAGSYDDLRLAEEIFAPSSSSDEAEESSDEDVEDPRETSAGTPDDGRDKREDVDLQPPS